MHVPTSPEFFYLLTVNPCHSPLRRPQFRSPIQMRKLRHKQVKELAHELNTWQSGCRVRGVSTVHAAQAGQGSEKAVILGPGPGFITFQGDDLSECELLHVQSKSDTLHGFV